MFTIVMRHEFKSRSCLPIRHLFPLNSKTKGKMSVVWEQLDTECQFPKQPASCCKGIARLLAAESTGSGVRLSTFFHLLFFSFFFKEILEVYLHSLLWVCYLMCICCTVSVLFFFFYFR